MAAVSSANDPPMQLRGPLPNGVYVKSRPAVTQGLQLKHFLWNELGPRFSSPEVLFVGSVGWGFSDKDPDQNISDWVEFQ